MRAIALLLGTLPMEGIATKAAKLLRLAVSVVNRESNFWQLYFAPNEIAGGLEWIRRPVTAWRDGQVADWGRDRLSGEKVWGGERVAPWDGLLPVGVGGGRLIGYANRYCDGDPHMDNLLDKQIGALRIVGVSDLALYVDDAQVGTVEAREGLRAALAAAKAGDTLVVLGLEYLGRSTAETMTTLQNIRGMGLHLWMLDTQLHTASPAGQSIFTVVDLLEAAQRRRHIAWSKTAIMAGVAEGRYTLGKKGVERMKLQEGGRLLLSGVAIDGVAEATGLAKSTVRKHRQTMLSMARSDLDDRQTGR